MRFTVALDGGCSGVIEVSGRAVATSESARARAERATTWRLALISEGPRARGWKRLIQLRPPSAPGAPAIPRSQPARLYGIAIVKLARNRWVDVRALGSFQGCSDEQLRIGSIPSALDSLLYTATVRARVVKR